MTNIDVATPTGFPDFFSCYEMLSAKADIQWCPTSEDLFLTWGTDLQFYQTRDVDNESEKLLSQSK